VFYLFFRIIGLSLIRSHFLELSEDIQIANADAFESKERGLPARIRRTMRARSPRSFFSHFVESVVWFYMTLYNFCLENLSVKRNDFSGSLEDNIGFFAME